jgi:hypothetical protein
MRPRILSFLAAMLVAWPGVAAACAVCFSGRTDETRIAFGISTAFMTLLPLIVIGSAVWWLRRRAAALQPTPAAVRLDPAAEKLAS